MRVVLQLPSRPRRRSPARRRASRLRRRRSPQRRRGVAGVSVVKKPCKKKNEQAQVKSGREDRRDAACRRIVDACRSGSARRVSQPAALGPGSDSGLAVTAGLAATPVAAVTAAPAATWLRPSRQPGCDSGRGCDACSAAAVAGSAAVASAPAAWPGRGATLAAAGGVKGSSRCASPDEDEGAVRRRPRCDRLRHPGGTRVAATSAVHRALP